MFQRRGTTVERISVRDAVCCARVAGSPQLGYAPHPVPDRFVNPLHSERELRLCVLSGIGDGDLASMGLASEVPPLPRLLGGHSEPRTILSSAIVSAC
jgi:hypothetical protein